MLSFNKIILWQKIYFEHKDGFPAMIKYCENHLSSGWMVSFFPHKVDIGNNKDVIDDSWGGLVTRKEKCTASKILYLTPDGSAPCIFSCAATLYFNPLSFFLFLFFCENPNKTEETKFDKTKTTKSRQKLFLCVCVCENLIWTDQKKTDLTKLYQTSPKQS